VPQARTTLAFKLLNYTKKRCPFLSLLLLSPLRDRNGEVVYLISTTQPRFLDPDSPELHPAPSHGPGAGHVSGHSAAVDSGVERPCSPLSPTLPPPRLNDARASELLSAATAATAATAAVAAAAAAAAAATAAATAATEAATAAPQPPAVPTPPRPVPTLEPDARPPQAPPLQADLDLVELLPFGELDEIARLMQLQPWRVSPPRQRAADPASSSYAINAALTAAIYHREAEACAAAAQATQAAAAAEPASQRSSVPPSASYGATESELRLESAAALRAAWLYGLGPVESSAAMQTATALRPLQNSPPHRMAQSDHPSGGASQPVAACGGAAHLGHGAGAAFGGGGGGGDFVAVAFGDGGESTAAAAAAVAAGCGAHGDASAAFGGGAAAVVPAATAMPTATWFAQAQMQMPMQAHMQVPAQPQMPMPTQMLAQMLSPQPTQPSVISLLDEIQRGNAALAHVQSGVSGTFAGASACSFGPGGGGCDSVSGVGHSVSGHSVLHGRGLSIATAALAPPSDWLCSSPGASASGAQGSGAAGGGGSCLCLGPVGAAAPSSAGGAGGARAGAMLVQQRYRECEQMLGLLEAAVLQLDTRYRCGAAFDSSTLPPRLPHLICSLNLTIACIGLARRQAKVSLSTSVEGLAGYLEAQPESAELVLQARRVGLLR